MAAASAANSVSSIVDRLAKLAINDAAKPAAPFAIYLYGGPGSGKSVYANLMIEIKVVQKQYQYEGGDCPDLILEVGVALKGGHSVVIASNVPPPEKLEAVCSLVIHTGAMRAKIKPTHETWTIKKGPNVGEQFTMRL